MKIFVNEPIHPAAMELLRSRAEVVSEWEDCLLYTSPSPRDA